MVTVFISMSVCGYVMRDVFVYWSNMFTRHVSRAIACRRMCSIVRSQALVVRGSVRFVCLATRLPPFEKTFLAPERHRHQARHVKRGAGRGDSANQPDEPAQRNGSCLRCVPENLVFGPE